MGEEAGKCTFTHERLLLYTCGRPAEFPQDGERVCLFHWDPQDEEGKRQKADLFNARFAEFVQEFERKGEEEQKEEPLDCAGFVFPAEFSFFANKKVPPARFGGATFGDGAWFFGATFGGWAWFFGASFGGRVSFDGAEFSEGARFLGATFRGRAWFARATFSEGTSFDGATFGERVSFEGATFGGGVSFVESVFQGSASFRRAAAKGEIRFQGNPRDPSRRLFASKEDAHVNFEGMRFEQPKRAFFHSVNLENASFLYADVAEADFSDVSWPPGRLFKGLIEGGKFLLDSPATLEALERLCQQLKLNYENKRNYAEAGEFHWAEMEYRRRRSWMNHEWLPAAMLGLYKLVSGYGERIGRAFVSLALILIVAALLHGGPLGGLYHSPKFLEAQDPADSDSAFPCVLWNGQPNRLLRYPPNLDAECTAAIPPSWPEVLGHAFKFSLLDFTFQRPDEYAAAKGAGKYVSLIGRVFFPVQLGLLLVAIKRRFRR